MAGQLNSNYLIEQKIDLDNSLDIFSAIKHLCPNPELGYLLLDHISKIEVVEGKCVQ